MSWTHLRDTTRTARREHRCYPCARPIPAGASYVERVGVWEFALSTTRMHPACERLTKAWGEDEWEAHDPHEFRYYELGERNDGGAANV